MDDMCLNELHGDGIHGAQERRFCELPEGPRRRPRERAVRVGRVHVVNDHRAGHNQVQHRMAEAMTDGPGLENTPEETQ